MSDLDQLLDLSNLHVRKNLPVIPLESSVLVEGDSVVVYENSVPDFSVAQSLCPKYLFN